METTDALNQFFTRVISDITADAAAQGQKFPVSSLRPEVVKKGETGVTGTLYGADYARYLFTGRGPGKFPPVDKMEAWVDANPDALARAKQVFKYITREQLAYLVGRKIAQLGTDIYTGKKKGIDFLGIVDKSLPELYQTIARNEAIKIGTDLMNAIK